MPLTLTPLLMILRHARLMLMLMLRYFHFLYFLYFLSCHYDAAIATFFCLR